MNSVWGRVHTITASHPRVRNVIAQHEEQLSLGQRVADRVAVVVGQLAIHHRGRLPPPRLWMGLNVYLVIMTVRQPGFLKA